MNNWGIGLHIGNFCLLLDPFQLAQFYWSDLTENYVHNCHQYKLSIWYNWHISCAVWLNKKNQNHTCHLYKDSWQYPPVLHLAPGWSPQSGRCSAPGQHVDMRDRWNEEREGTLWMLTQPPGHFRSIDPPQPGMSFWIMHESSEHVVEHWCSGVTGVTDVSSHVGRVPPFVHLNRRWVYVYQENDSNMKPLQDKTKFAAVIDNMANLKDYGKYSGKKSPPPHPFWTILGYLLF